MPAWKAAEHTEPLDLSCKSCAKDTVARLAFAYNMAIHGTQRWHIDQGITTRLLSS